MSVYVDPIRRVKGRRWCHLLADSVEELHSFAQRIGVKRRWFQNHRHPHYDLSVTKRRLAVNHGATQSTTRELLMGVATQEALPTATPRP